MIVVCVPLAVLETLAVSIVSGFPLPGTIRTSFDIPVGLRLIMAVQTPTILHQACTSALTVILRGVTG